MYMKPSIASQLLKYSEYGYFVLKYMYQEIDGDVDLRKADFRKRQGQDDTCVEKYKETRLCAR